MGRSGGAGESTAGLALVRRRRLTYDTRPIVAELRDKRPLF